MAMWTAVVWTAEVRRHKHSDSQMRAGYIWDGTDWVGLGYFVSPEPLVDMMMMTSHLLPHQRFKFALLVLSSSGALNLLQIASVQVFKLGNRDYCDIQRL